MKNTLLVTTLLIGLGIQAQASAPLCSKVFISESRNDQKAFENIIKHEGIYTRHRGLMSYQIALGESFTKAINASLSSKKPFHWLDSGGGDGVAISDYLSLAAGKSNIKTTLLSYETPAVPSAAMNVMKGRFLENIPQNEIPKSDLITDVYGPLAYSSRPDLVLSAYFKALNPDGKIIVSLGSDYGVFGLENKVSLNNGQIISFEQWIKSIPDINLKFDNIARANEFNDGQIHRVEITLKDGRIPQVPALELVHIKEGMPPVMMFKESQLLNGTTANTAKIEQALETIYSKKSANEFFDSFRTGAWTGAWTHALLGSVKSLKPNDTWLIMAPNAYNVKKEITSGNFSLNESSFDGWGQSFTLWRSRDTFANLRTYIAATNDMAAVPRDGKTRLITDYAGPMQSSSRPDLVLKKYIESISTDGEIYIFLGNSKFGFGERTYVIRDKDAPSSFLDIADNKVYFLKWLSNIDGLSVDTFRDPYLETGVTFVRIKVRDKSDVKIPELEFLGAGENNVDGVPSSLFKETGLFHLLR